MADFFSAGNLATLVMLILLQAVLGFDNLLYISMESKRVEEASQSYVRKMGIGVAIVLRLILLFALVNAIKFFQDPFWSFESAWAEGAVSGHALITLLGGAFIIYTAMKEIFHMLAPAELGEAEQGPERSVASAITWIVVMNLVFSFDSILSAIALTDVFATMAVAVVVSGMLMILLADRVSTFLQRNRMYEVLGLFVLLLVGIMLVSEGGELAHLSFFGYEVHAMTKSTFYFVLAVLLLVDIVQGRYQRKLLTQAEKDA